MQVQKSILLALPINERLELAEELWSSVEAEFHKDSSDDIAFAKERLNLHLEDPETGYSINQLKKYFSDRYGI